MKRALCLLLALAGCTAPAAPAPLVVTKTIYVPFVFPAYLKSCPADPAVKPWPMQSDVAHYIVALKSAGDDCRDTLAAAVFAASQPMVK